MSKSPDVLQTAEHSRKVPLAPRKIDNFDHVATGESAHGNAGKNGIGIMGKIDADMPGGIRLVTHHGREGKDFFYRVHADIMQIMEQIDKGNTPPPILIKEVVMSSDETDSGVPAQAARNHNAAEMIDYLRKGGDPSLLTTGELIPTMKEIQDYMKKQDRKSIADKVRAIFSRKH